MAPQEQRRHERREDEPDEAPAPPPPAAVTTSSSDAEVDDLLDEIDDVLEANAETFVRSFVQKGGQ